MAERPDQDLVSEDRLLDGRVRLLQPRRGHRAGTDAVLLAGLALVREADRVVDLGSASGAVGLMIALRRPEVSVTFVERDATLVDLCRRNIALNGLGGRAVAVEADIFAPSDARDANGVSPGAADLVVTNPPFFDEQPLPSPEPSRRAAHLMAGGGFEDWVRYGWDCLRPRGRFAAIYRADRLDACLRALRPGFGALRVVPIYPREGAPASRVVVCGQKGGRGPLEILPPLVLHLADGSFTPEAERLNRFHPDRVGA